MGRKTAVNNHNTNELYEKVSNENKELVTEFLEYLNSTDKAATTIISYTSDLKIFMVWNMESNNNKFFVDFTKRDIMKYQNYLMNKLNLSSNRVRRARSTVSSLSNFIESILDDLYPDFRNIVNKIPAPIKQETREKTILSEEQIDSLLKQLVDEKKYQLACAVALGCACGARKSELARFKVSYFKDEYIIYGSLYKTPEKITTKGRGRNGKQLFKYSLVNVIKPYLDLWLIERERLGVDSDDLFTVKYDGKWKTAKDSTLSSWAGTISTMINDDFYFHLLRHYWTTSMRKANLPDKVIQELCGWASTDLINLYDDADIDDELGKYFDEGGIKQVEQKGLSDL